jgi:hypothetical protein
MGSKPGSKSAYLSKFLVVFLTFCMQTTKYHFKSCYYYFIIRKSHSVVRIVTTTMGWTTDERWFDSNGGDKDLCLPSGSRPAPGPTQSPTECVLEGGGVPPEATRLRYVADASPQFRTKYRSNWRYTSTPLYAILYNSSFTNDRNIQRSITRAPPPSSSTP